jgi:AcrR family transcriptional regulator
MPPTASKRVSQLRVPADTRSRKPANNPVGRPIGRDSQQTRLVILDVSEAILSEHGYEGTSIRDIATGANVQAAAIGYHYGTKADLFNAVVARRAQVINEARSRSLETELLARQGQPLAVETLIAKYVEPLLEATSHGDQGWRNFASLMGRLANSPRGTDMINQHYSDVAGLYMAEFRRALPGMPEERLADGFLYMVSAMLFVCADTGRWEAMLGRKAQPPRDSAAILSDLVPFVAGGFKALADIPTTSTQKSAKKR